MGESTGSRAFWKEVPLFLLVYKLELPAASSAIITRNKTVKSLKVKKRKKIFVSTKEIGMEKNKANFENNCNIKS